MSAQVIYAFDDPNDLSEARDVLRAANRIIAEQNVLIAKMHSACKPFADALAGKPDAIITPEDCTRVREAVDLCEDRRR